jgi:hypothetical protein
MLTNLLGGVFQSPNTEKLQAKDIIVDVPFEVRDVDEVVCDELREFGFM